MTVHASRYLRLEVAGVESSTGRGGVFYLENVPPGQHKARFYSGEDKCLFTIEMPDRAGLVDLGMITCDP